MLSIGKGWLTFRQPELVLISSAPTRRAKREMSITLKKGRGLRDEKKPSSCVKIGDSVWYCFVDAEDDKAFVTIVPYHSNRNLGLINAETAIAKALLGGEKGREVDALFPPTGRRRLRILHIHKRDRPNTRG